MIRAFVALSISELLERQLSLHAKSLLQQFPNENLRWVPSHNYHITLAFLGDIQPQLVPKIESILQSVAARFTPEILTVNDVVWFPSIHKPKLLVATLDESKQLMALQAALCNALRKKGLTVAGRRFKPHVSLARASRQQSAKKFQLVLGDLTTEMDELVLYKSQLGSGGSTYSPLTAVLIEH